MKIIIALLGGLGLSILATPMATATVITPYVNCSAAYADGVSNVLKGDARYQPKLDSDLDGVGCESPPWETKSYPCGSHSTRLPCPSKTTTTKVIDPTTTTVQTDPTEAHEEAPEVVRVTPKYTG